MVEQKMRCDLCGRNLQTTQIELVSRTGQYLCEDCLAEELSCGCADEDGGYCSEPGSAGNNKGGGKTGS